MLAVVVWETINGSISSLHKVNNFKPSTMILILVLRSRWFYEFEPKPSFYSKFQDGIVRPLKTKQTKKKRKKRKNRKVLNITVLFLRQGGYLYITLAVQEFTEIPLPLSGIKGVWHHIQSYKLLCNKYILFAFVNEFLRFLETGSQITQATLESAVQLRLSSNSWSFCFQLPKCWDSGMHYQAWITKYSFWCEMVILLNYFLKSL